MYSFFNIYLLKNFVKFIKLSCFTMVFILIHVVNGKNYVCFYIFLVFFYIVDFLMVKTKNIYNSYDGQKTKQFI